MFNRILIFIHLSCLSVLLAAEVSASVVVNDGETYTVNSNGTGDALVLNEDASVNTGGTLYCATMPQNTNSLTVTLAGGTLQFNQTNTNDSYHANAAVCISGTTAKTFTISGSGTLIKSGARNLWMNYRSGSDALVVVALDANSWIRIHEGTLTNGGAKAQDWSQNRAQFEIASGAVLNLRDGKTLYAAGFSGAGNLMYGNTGEGGSLTIGTETAADYSATFDGTVAANASVTGALNFTKTGAGTQKFTGNVTLARTALQINGGTLSFTNLTMPSVETAAGTAAGSVTLSGTSSNSAALDLSALTSDAVLYNLAGNEYSTFSGSATQTVTINNTDDTVFSGTFSAPKLVVNAVGTDAVTAKTLTLSGSSVSLGDAAVNVGTAAVTQAYSNSAPLTKSGSGTLNFQNAYSGGKITIDEGTVSFTNNASLNSDVLAKENSTLYFAVMPRNTEDVTITLDGGAVEFHQTNTTDGSHGSNAVCISSTENKTVTITGSGTFIKSGARNLWTNYRLNPNDANFVIALDSDSWIRIEEGTLTNGGAQAQNWTNNQASMFIAEGAVFNMRDGADVYLGALTGAGTFQFGSGEVTRTLSLGAGNTSGNFDGKFELKAAGCLLSLVKTGSGTQTFNGAYTMNGTISVNDGTLRFGDSAAVAPSAAYTPGTLTVSVASNAALELGTGSYDFTSMTLNGLLALTFQSAEEITDLQLTNSLEMGAGATLDVLGGYVGQEHEQIILPVSVTGDFTDWEWNAHLTNSAQELWNLSYVEGTGLIFTSTSLPEPTGFMLVLLGAALLPAGVRRSGFGTKRK